MGRLSTSTIISLGLVKASLAVGNNIGSCVDVQCPLSPGTRTEAKCNIYNQTLNAVGAVNYEVPLPNVDSKVESSDDSETINNIWSGGSTNQSLSWTVGISNAHHLIDAESPTLRHIDRIYYLSTPPTLDLTSANLTYAGCALYMTSEDNKSVFYDAAANQRSKHSYCRTLMGYSCHDALYDSARSFASQLTADNNPSAPVATSCTALAAHLQSTLRTSCPNLDPATTVKGVALTGPTAASPITAEQNRSSDCHPTTLKENKLTRSFSYYVTTLVYSNETLPALLGETPLWSVFYSLSNGTEGGVGVAQGLEEPDVQLLCLRPVDENMLDWNLTPGTTTELREEVTGSTGAAMGKRGISWVGLGGALALAAWSGGVYI